MALPLLDNRDLFSQHLLKASIVFSALYWFVESALHCFVFREGSLTSQLFSPNIHEIWMRLIVAALMVIFGFYGQAIINQRKRAERAVIQREKETARVLENNPAATVLIDVETRQIAYANTNALELVGAPAEKMVGQACHCYICPTEKEKCPVLDLDKSLDLSERVLLTADNRTVPILKSVTRIQYKGRDHLLEAFFDLTEQKRMQRAIRHAHAELDQIFQTASVGMRVIDAEFNILKVNRAFSQLAGVDADDAVGKKCFDIFAGSMCRTPDCPLNRILNGEPRAEYEVSKKRLDGTGITCLLTATRFEGEDGSVRGIVEAFKDVTELKNFQEQLQTERDRLHHILFHQFESVGIVNQRYALEYQNETLEKETAGIPNAPCHQVFRTMGEPCRGCLMQEALRTAQIQRVEFDGPDGRSYEHTYTPFTDSNGEKKAVVSRRDITERKTSMSAALYAEHLAALGELAAGVAHEINNPINGIINYGQMLANKTQPTDILNEIAQRVIREGDRIAAIVESLLCFARREGEAHTTVSVQDLIEDTLTLTGAQMRKDGIKLEVDIPEALPLIAARPQELQQVFMNLINNSRYALNQKFVGHDPIKALRISARVDGDNWGHHVWIDFEDNGMGITPQAMDKVMNPFFSTKPKGKGTGLGLSISHGIIERHGGNLKIDSVEGEFTRVAIQLPAISETANG